MELPPKSLSYRASSRTDARTETSELLPSEAHLANILSRIIRRIASDNLSPEARRQQ